MKTTRKAAAAPSHPSAADSTAAVDAFMAGLEHPFKREIEALRRIILGADARIAEGIKWKAPSFRTDEYFATMHLRATSGIALILHFGAKVRQLPDTSAAIDDPARLLKWLAADRAIVAFEDGESLAARQLELAALIRQWIAVHDR